MPQLVPKFAGKCTFFFKNFQGSIPPDPPSKQRLWCWLAQQDAGASLVRSQHPPTSLFWICPCTTSNKSYVLIVIALYILWFKYP